MPFDDVEPDCRGTLARTVGMVEGLSEVAHVAQGDSKGESENGSSKDTGAAEKSADEKSADDKNDKPASDDAGQKSTGGRDGGKKGDGKSEEQAPRSKKPLIILAIAIVVLGIVGLFFWFATRNRVTTDDAYTDGNTVTMAPKVAGYVVELYINDNTRVKKGDVLLRIDPRDYLAAKAQADAQLALARAQREAARVAYEIARVQYPAQFVAAKAQQRAAEASFAQAQQSYLRQHSVDRRATTEENIDAANSQEVTAAANVESATAQVAIAGVVPDQLRQAQTTVAERDAQVKDAEAQLAQAQLNLSYTEVRAPTDGFITKRNVQLGSYLTSGSTMFLIVTPDIWITANFKESQLGRMRPGNPVDITVDAYSGLELHGHVDSIQYGTGSRFAAFPTENATGNFVKIVQRVPVKIVIDSGLDPNAPLPLGLSVSPVVRLP
jgi:membrane fusion protein, multidrug efflux system